ncbi:putative F-box protein At1g32420 [Bidens hawaiensis]|uniref:putative F-box protein At1g32420 n=1 Tax=Bidens hawaiensis TaxID=980011 RepID=UPI0040493BCA
MTRKQSLEIVNADLEEISRASPVLDFCLLAILPKIETLEERSLTEKENNSFPSDIIEEIVLRLPIKSILRFRSVSKPWLSRISDQSFSKLHFTRATAAHRTALFIAACSVSGRKLHLFSAAHDGGPVTHLMSLDFYPGVITEVQHLNGLICFALCKLPDYFHSHNVFVVNPSTRNIYKLPASDSYALDKGHASVYLFGFDESRNEHKILLIRKLFEIDALEFMIFSLSNYSWRRIDAEPPTGFSLDGFCFGFYLSYNVCLNSVVHRMLTHSFDILAFDLRTEKFSIINTPEAVITDNDVNSYLIKVNGCVGVVCHAGVEENNDMNLWILKDYENRVWVREVIKFPESFIEFGLPFPSDSVDTDEIICSSSKVSGNVISVPVYNMKSKCFKSLEFTSDHPLSYIANIKCYVESIVPVRRN